MSWHDCTEAECRFAAAEIDPIETVIVPRSRDLGGFEVRRVLPSSKKRMVGPFIFFDQMGPNEFILGRGIDVRPHPHIGLATVTYLFTGEIMHRDSLGTALPIQPGAVNWMTAGQGIAHSERTPEELRRGPSELFGLQAWIALPRTHEETAPDFTHHPKDALPVISDKDKDIRLIAGELFGARSSVPTFSAMFYADCRLDAGASLPFDPVHEERGLYLVSGRIEIDGQVHEPGRLLIVKEGAPVTIRALDEARFMLLGGEPADGPRHIWWNFVSSSKERIEQAKADWKAGRFDAVPGEVEYIPLPES